MDTTSEWSQVRCKIKVNRVCLDKIARLCIRLLATARIQKSRWPERVTLNAHPLSTGHFHFGNNNGYLVILDMEQIATFDGNLPISWWGIYSASPKPNIVFVAPYRPILLGRRHSRPSRQPEFFKWKHTHIFIQQLVGFYYVFMPIHFLLMI